MKYLNLQSLKGFVLVILCNVAHLNVKINSGLRAIKEM